MEVQVLSKPARRGILGAFQALALRGIVLVALGREAVDETCESLLASRAYNVGMCW